MALRSLRNRVFVLIIRNAVLREELFLGRYTGRSSYLPLAALFLPHMHAPVRIRFGRTVNHHGNQGLANSHKPHLRRPGCGTEMRDFLLRES
jgi:hypothetical protein